MPKAMTIVNVKNRLRRPKGFSCKINRSLSKGRIADAYDVQGGKLEAAARRIIRQAEIIERLELQNAKLKEALNEKSRQD